jgi:hypothetical protein
MSTMQPQPLEHLTGTFERVTFHSEETGFYVLRVNARMTVVGTLPGVRAANGLTRRADLSLTPNTSGSLRLRRSEQPVGAIASTSTGIIRVCGQASDPYAVVANTLQALHQSGSAMNVS